MKPCIVVAGEGRCGTSLMMQMLDAAGVPCIGEWPDFETDDGHPEGFDAQVFADRRSCALKLIDPFRLGVRDMPNHVVIWMKRNRRDQARSQVKLLEWSGIEIPHHRSAVRSMEKSMRKTSARNRAAVGIPGGCPFIEVVFENLLQDARPAVTRLAEFLDAHGWPDLSVDAMRKQVRQRTPRCYPGMMEDSLLAERRRRV